MTRLCTSDIRILSRFVLFLGVVTVLMLAASATAQNPSPLASSSGTTAIDPTNRTVTTSNFFVAWNTGNDVEAITTFNWAGGGNVTNSWALDTCAPAFPGTVEYFGDSFAPPDPWLGGLALVGGGTTTPSGTTAWSGQILPSGTAQVTINSKSTGCPPSSAGINVKTTYSFSSPDDPSTNWFGVQRAFDFTTTTFDHAFRPYMPRLSLSEGFTQVLYPTTSGTLATRNVFDCGSGCTGPIVIAQSAPLNPPWDATQGWFAMHNPATLQGVIVKRNPSNDPHGNVIVAQLWVDNDASSSTNSSSFLLMSPTGGFTGGLVTEMETLCFYNSSLWTPSLTLPAECNGGPGDTPTSTILTSSLNPANYGQSVTFTASVSSTEGTPTGTVVFSDASTASTLGGASLASGTASISVSPFAAGTHSIIAAYQGSSTFAASKSAPLVQTVTQAATTTSLTSSLNPAATKQSITFTASVASQYGGAAIGTVTFTAGAQNLGSAQLSGNIATLTTSFPTAGTYPVTALYGGDSNNTGSTSGALSVKIIAATTTTLISSLNPSVVGQAVTFTATLTSSSGNPPNGETITFYSGTAVLGTAPLSADVAMLKTSALPAGVFTITARYPGDPNFAASSSPGLRQVVNSTTKSATTTSLASSLNPSIYGQKIVLTATVSTSGPVPPTGTVAFTGINNFGTFTIGTATVNSNGVATLSRSNLNAGPYPLTAVYKGDTNNLASTSTVLNQTVLQTTTKATITSALNPSTVGQAVTFTAKITSPTVMPTGPVWFSLGPTTLGTVQLSGGKATFTTSSLPAGSNAIKVIYQGNSNIARSSALLTQVVQ